MVLGIGDSDEVGREFKREAFVSRERRETLLYLRFAGWISCDKGWMDEREREAH